MRLSLIPIFVLGYLMLEIAGFILVGDALGVLPTLGLILLSGVVGAVLMRAQGLAVFNRVRLEAASGRVPGRELVHGFMILLAGILLLLPGFFTDAFGLLLFLPPVREAVWRFLKNRLTIITSFSGPRRPAGPGRIVDLDRDDFHRTQSESPAERRLDRE